MLEQVVYLVLSLCVKGLRTPSAVTNKEIHYVKYVYTRTIVL